MKKPRLAVDWDGTVVKAVWPERDGDWNPGAIDALRELSNYYYITIHTARIASVTPDGVHREPHVVADEINYIRAKLDSVGLTMIDIHTAPYKPGAFRYIDDRAMKYTGRKGSWGALTESLIALAPQASGIDLQERNTYAETKAPQDGRRKHTRYSVEFRGDL